MSPLAHFLASGSQLYLTGVAPAWNILSAGPVEIRVGLFAGWFSIHQEYYSPAALFPKVVITADRFALGPVLGADVSIIAGLFGTTSVQYVKAIGPDTDLGIWAPMAGLGYRF